MKKGRILIVEDERIVALDVKAMLQDLRYDVVGVIDSGKEAIQAVLDTKPDLILMDIHLKGDMDGVDAGIKIWDRYKIPVIYTSGYSDDRTLNRLKKAKAIAFVPKPYDKIELDAVIGLTLLTFQKTCALR